MSFLWAAAARAKPNMALMDLRKTPVRWHSESTEGRLREVPNSPATPYRVQAFGATQDNRGGYSAIMGTADDTNAGLFYNNSASGWTTLYAQNDESSNAGNHVLEAYGSAFGGRCYIDVIGNLVCTGTKSAVVPVDGGTRKVALYAVESPENWFEDFGSGKLTNGVAVVTLEPTFAQTVNAATNYHVFLTPNGECNGLAVTQKTATSFEVHELHGGGSDVEFDYRIVARRKGYENIRLADKTKQLESPRIAERKPGERRMPTLPTMPPMPRQMEPPTRVPIAQSSTPNQGGQPLK